MEEILDEESQTGRRYTEVSGKKGGGKGGREEVHKWSHMFLKLLIHWQQHTDQTRTVWLHSGIQLTLLPRLSNHTLVCVHHCWKIKVYAKLYVHYSACCGVFMWTLLFRIQELFQDLFTLHHTPNKSTCNYPIKNPDTSLWWSLVFACLSWYLASKAVRLIWPVNQQKPSKHWHMRTVSWSWASSFVEMSISNWAKLRLIGTV